MHNISSFTMYNISSFTMPSSNSSVSPFSFPPYPNSSGTSFETSTAGSSFNVNPSQQQPLLTGSSFVSGFPANSRPTFVVVSSSAACSSPGFGGFPVNSSSTSSPAFGFSAPTLSTASTAFPPSSLFGDFYSAPPSSAPPSFPSFGLGSSSSLFSASSAQAFPFGTGSVFSKSNTGFAASAASVSAVLSSSLSSSSSITTSSFHLRTPSSSASGSSFGLKSAPSSNDSGSFSITTSSSASFQSSSGDKSASSAEVSDVSTAMTSSATTMMPASLDVATSSAPSISSTVIIPGVSLPAVSTTPFSAPFLFSSQAAGSTAYVPSVPVTGVTTALATNTSTLASKSTIVSSAPSISSTVTIPGVSLPAVSTTPFSAPFLFSSQAAGSTAYVPSVPVTGVTTSLATNTSTSASKSTIFSSATNSPSAFPSFSLPAKISAPATSSQPQSTTSAAMSVLAIKDGVERMQRAKSDLVEVGVQCDLPAHKVNQVAGSEIVRSGPSEAEPCMERMQAENPDLEVGVQPALLAERVNHGNGSEIVRTGPEGVPHLDKVVDQLETSARPVDVLTEYRSTEDQPMDQSVVQSTPVDTVREFEAATSFQEDELNRIFPNLFVCVEGFLVPKPYVELYQKILRRYGHMATTEVLTDCPLGLMGVATEVMRLFEEMASCTKADLSEDLLRRWDFRLSSAESLKFKVDWLRQRLEEVKSSYRHQIENADAIEAVHSSLAVTESKLTAVIARREDHLKEKQAAEASLKAVEAALATVNATLQQDDEEISVFESEKLGQLVKLCVVEGDFMPGVTLASDLL